MNNPTPIIQITNLYKTFGKKEVLRGVDLEVPQGSIFGFLGLNGMGKTTLIRTLLGLLRPDQGRCLVDGIDTQVDALEVRRRVGYMAENQIMYGWMRISQLIDWVSKFYPNWDPDLAQDLLKRMRLEGDKKVGTLSKGQTSHLALLLALSHKPKIVILDDPTLGLDPIARKQLLRDIIIHLQNQGVSVFFSSHLLYEIEPICDQVAVLHEGKIIQSGPVDELRERVKKVFFKKREGVRVSEIPGLLDARHYENGCAITVADFKKARSSLDAMQDAFSVHDLNLDEIFEAYAIGQKEMTNV